jgi:hypothetical protein
MEHLDGFVAAPLVARQGDQSTGPQVGTIDNPRASAPARRRENGFAAEGICV